MFTDPSHSNLQPNKPLARDALLLVNFDELCRADAAATGFDPTAPGAINPYLDPAKMGDLIDRHHAKLANAAGVAKNEIITAGGYLEIGSFQKMQNWLVRSLTSSLPAIIW